MATDGERRARAVAKAWEKVQADSTLSVTTGDGREVHIDDMSVNGESVSVRLSGVPAGGDPSFVIVNPPTLVPDPTGDRIINGMRFREDPLGALAAVIADHGGSAQKSKRRGRR